MGKNCNASKAAWLIAATPREPMKTIIAIAIILAAGFAQAHSGGTDSQGCHVDHKTGIRHCH